MIVPRNDLILVRIHEFKEYTVGQFHLIIPVDAQDKRVTGTIDAIGPLVTEFSVGQTVLIPFWFEHNPRAPQLPFGIKVDHDGVEYRLIKPFDILGTYEEV